MVTSNSWRGLSARVEGRRVRGDGLDVGIPTLVADAFVVVHRKCLRFDRWFFHTGPASRHWASRSTGWKPVPRRGQLLARLTALFVLAGSLSARAADANRLAYLDELNPYYVSRSFPKLVTPQWVGEDGVDAVVVLAIDDMRDPQKYEQFLRPILNRLKQIDGKAHLSIMTCQIKPDDPQLRKFLAEGVSLETHTVDHPCPLLAHGDFAKAKSTFDRCVEQLFAVPNNRPVAFRMPCCDSKNTPSPRFYSEIFNKTTDKGNFLTIDSSVFNLITASDPALPREWVLNPDGTERFRRYVPFESFANYVEDYPYPYVVGNLCWEFPCMVPSDWESQNIQKSANSRLLEDWKAALDATVAKQGTMTLVFHPYGWSTPQQHVDLVSYAASKYGKRVKFLSFSEALERIEKNLLGGQSLRQANGQDNGVRLMDLNNDGYMDVVIGNNKVRQTRVWSPREGRWITGDFPMPIGDGVRFGILQSTGYPFVLLKTEQTSEAWQFDGSRWNAAPSMLAGLDDVFTSQGGLDRGVRFRDLEGDGRCELIVANDKRQAVFAWDEKQQRWTKLPFTLPAGTSVVDAQGHDAGLRFVDVDGDGHDDVLFSDDTHYSVHLFTSMKDGWGKQIKSGKRGDAEAIPPLVRGGTNNGGWFLNRYLWIQNEDTTNLPDQVDRRSFNRLLSGSFLAARSPEASLKSIQLRPGFQAELVAAEPLVQDPIAFAWGADGKLWVVEMSDYPLGVDGHGKPGGRIKILEDTNGDGRYTKATVFLDNLPFPTGVMPWGKGVLITDAPNILYAEDTKGDGKADVVKVLYNGFIEGNQQHRSNGLLYGLDNWIHGANGHSGGHVKSAMTGAVVDISGRDFRIKPDEGLIEATTGISQYGHCMDDWGNWFGCDNSNPNFQFVLDDRYLRRNPHFAPPRPTSDVPEVPGAAPVYPISPDLPRFNDFWSLHHFTSANSVIVYRDDLFGPLFEGNTFVSEPVANLVHREVMSRDGVLFHSRRAPGEEKSEFFASTDDWCRTTMLRTGPDGALWVCDMYRLVIEHPEWIPKEWQEKLDLRAGHDMGRIYRVFPVGTKPRTIPRLDKLDAAGLVAALDTPSGWQRDMAQQLLVQRHDLAAVGLLEKAAVASKRDVTRLHALCTLEGLGALTSELLEKALADSQPGVRRQAVRMCESQLAKLPRLGERVIALVDDPDPQVRMQVAYSLGEWNDPRAAEALGRLAAASADEPYITAAVLSSLTKQNLEPVMAALLSRNKGRTPAGPTLANLLRFARSVGDLHAVVAVLNQVSGTPERKVEPSQIESAGVLLDAMAASQTSLGALEAQGDEETRSAVARFSRLFDSARAIVADEAAPSDVRAGAVRLLGRGADAKQDVTTLAGLLTPQTPPQLQSAAISALARGRDASARDVLIRNWKNFSPAARAQVLDAMLNRHDWAPALVEAIAKKQIPAVDIAPVHRQRLLNNPDASVRERAAALLAESVSPDRQKVVDAFQPALKLTGDPSRGAQVFAKTCVACHHFGGIGNAVGPDLASIGDKSPETLLISILDPNRAVEPRYVGYVVETKDGRTLTGVLGGETSTTVTLMQPSVEPLQILRTDIKSLRSTGISLMPEGLEAGMSQQDLADLIDHVRSIGPQPQRREFDGNNPRIVMPDNGGRLWVPAAAAEIYGPDIAFEMNHGNVGYWGKDEDYVVWTVQPARAGRYQVWMDYACENDSAGNFYLLQAGPSRLTGRIDGTGAWDDYKHVKLGEVVLTAGRQHITFRSNGKLSGALCDLQAIELMPVRE